MDVKEKKSLSSPVFSVKNKLVRVLWRCAYIGLFRFTPIPLFGLRRFVLRCFGATVGLNVNIYPTCKIWLPSNLIINNGSGIGPNVNVYNQGEVTIGENVIVSQGAHLCASTHNYNDPLHPLILAPITIENNVWICAEAFVGPNVVLAEGSVVGARAVIMKKTEPWGVYAGNPAIKIKNRSWSDE
jgi:putative colanic acid biosynthesis acetyltransferase WcaF